MENSEGIGEEIEEETFSLSGPFHRHWRSVVARLAKRLVKGIYRFCMENSEGIGEEIEKETFSLSGPFHLTSADWQNADYRRSVAASLVKGVYILERDRDRQMKRQDQYALANDWWEFFNFKLNKLIRDEKSYIVGAIYEYKPTHRNQFWSSNQGAPRFVIAFRGTVLKGDTAFEDVKQDVNIMINRLHKTSRYTKALEEVQDFVKENSDMNIWIAGHSLGSAMGMLVGKTMAVSGIFLDAFLFNPPIVSSSYKWISVLKSFTKAAVSVACQSDTKRKDSEKNFEMLSSWCPNLFVHPFDIICSSYIGYFERWQKMGEYCGLGCVGRLAMLEDSMNRLHVLPSACLNVSPDPGFREAHGLHQWWKTGMNLKSTVYRNMSSYQPAI